MVAAPAGLVVATVCRPTFVQVQRLEKTNAVSLSFAHQVGLVVVVCAGAVAVITIIIVVVVIGVYACDNVIRACEWPSISCK